jgi:hypothetical protein
MGWEHRTVGFDKFDTVLSLLEALEIPYQAESESGLVPVHAMDEMAEGRLLRRVSFEGPRGTMVAEEFEEVVDTDCDGTSVISVSIYQQGQRPELKARIVDYDPLSL